MIIFFIILVLINIVFNFNNLMSCTYNSLFIWFYNVYPSVFIFYSISSYLINNYYFNKLARFLKILIRFDSNKSYSLLLINMFLGNPGTTKLIENSLNNNEISFSDYNKLLNITFFMNPLFILNFFKLKNYFLYILSIFIYIKIYSLSHKFYHKSTNYNFAIIKNKYTFSNLKNSIHEVIDILLNIACMITLFSVIKTSIIYFLTIFKLSNSIILKTILAFFEVTSGLYDLKDTYLWISILLITFQGFCILLQSYNFINKKNISFKRYILIRIVSCITTTAIFIALHIIFDKLQLLHFL